MCQNEIVDQKKAGGHLATVMSSDKRKPLFENQRTWIYFHTSSTNLQLKNSTSGDRTSGRPLVIKVIIEKSRGEVSLMGQDTIANIS